MLKVIRTGPLGVNSLIVSLTGNKVFIVDPAACSFCGDETKITSYLAQEKLEPAAIILTHGHFDHIAGLSFLKKSYPGIPILIHKNDASMIGRSGGQIQARQLSYLGFESFAPAVSALPEPDAFMEDKKSLAECMESLAKPFDDKLMSSFDKWTVLHTPGHTYGSVCLYNKPDGVLLSGDTLFYGSWGRTDLGGNEAMMMQSLGKIKEIVAPDTIVYPGHDYFGFALKDGI